MADEEPPSSLCRIWSAMTLLVRLKNKIREKLWVSRIFIVPDDHMETETAASTSNQHPQQDYYDASSQAFEPPPVTSFDNPGDLKSQMWTMEQENAHTEREVIISLADFGEPLVDHRSISEDCSSAAADCDMQDDDQSSLQRGWSAPVEMIDTGGSSDRRQSSSSAVDWQKILWIRQMLGLDVEVLPGREWTVVLRVVSAFKRMPGLIRRRRQERPVVVAQRRQQRAVVAAQNQAAVAPRVRRIRSAEGTRYTGIRRRNDKWVCEIRVAGTKEKVWLGSFNTDKEAALAFDAGTHHCSLKRVRYNFASTPELLGAPQRFEHLTPEERKENVQRLAEAHAQAYASTDIQ